MDIPLTFKCAEWSVIPALFWMMQVYFPECSAWTESMLKVLIFLPAFVISIPSSLPTVLLSWYHVIFIGKSPLWAVHMTDATSPEFTDSSPKSNGVIWGGTKFVFVRNGIKSYFLNFFLLPSEYKLISVYQDERIEAPYRLHCMDMKFIASCWNAVSYHCKNNVLTARRTWISI